MDWICSYSDPLIETLFGSILIFVSIIIITRIVGLRTFAKFTAYDFAFTIAIGSIISSILTSSTSIIHGMVAITGLLMLTFIFSTLQRKFVWLSSTISNRPLLLMKDAKIIDNNLKHTRI